MESGDCTVIISRHTQCYRWRDIVDPNGIPAIIDEELFERVQARMRTYAKAPAKGKAKVPFLLTGKFFCGLCGAEVRGDSGTSRSGDIYTYYSCRNRKTRKGKNEKCGLKSVRQDMVENLVISAIHDNILTEKVIDDLTKMILQYQEQEVSTLPALHARKQSIEKKLRNILNAIETGIISETTQQRLLELESDKRDVETLIAKEMIAKPKLTRGMIADWFDAFKKGDVHSMVYRKMLVDSFIQKILLYEDKLVIILNYKGGTKDVVAPHALCSDLMTFGTPGWNRTNGTWLRRPLLYPLSYGCAFPFSFRLIATGNRIKL